MKKFMSTLLCAAMTAVMMFSANIASASSAVPEGYAETDYVKARTFLETKDENGVTNGEKVGAKLLECFGSDEDDEYSYKRLDIDDPATWAYYYMEGSSEGFNWNKMPSELYGGEGERSIDAIRLDGDGVVGNLDASGMKELYFLSITDNSVSSLNVEGCDNLRCLFVRDTLIKSIKWNDAKDDVSIVLNSDGEGYVEIYANHSYGTGDEEAPYTWMIDARPADESKVFVGWYDENGKLVSDKACYEFYTNTALIDPDGCMPPYGEHLNLTARFEKASEPAVTDAPAATTAPVTPGVPRTGSESIWIIGAVVILGGVFAAVMAGRKSKADAK